MYGAGAGEWRMPVGVAEIAEYRHSKATVMQPSGSEMQKMNGRVKEAKRVSTFFTK